VPPAGAAGGRIGIVHEEREALRALGRAGPRQGGRHVLAGAAEAVEHMLLGDQGVRLDVGARVREGLGERQAGDRQIGREYPASNEPGVGHDPLPLSTFFVRVLAGPITVTVSYTSLFRSAIRARTEGGMVRPSAFAVL